MTDERIKVSMCISKARHDTFAAAKRQLAKGKRVRKGFKAHDMKINIYKCAFCPGYHIGHSVRKKKAKFKKGNT